MNTNRGLWRLWLVVSGAWIAFCAYQLYVHHKRWENGFAAAKAQSDALESEQELMIQNYVFDAKARHAQMVKDGYLSGAFDEARAKEEAVPKVRQAQARSEEYQIRERSYRNAFAARDVRDSYWPLLPSVPVIVGLIIAGIAWVLRGFKKS